MLLNMPNCMCVCMPKDYSLKVKEIKQLEKYQDIFKMLGKLWNMNIRSFLSYCSSYSLSYLSNPTPPLGQDMTQGQFLSGV